MSEGPSGGTATAPLPFDIRSIDNPSFTALLNGRSEVFRNPREVEAFRSAVSTLGADGDEGRRKGLGYWVLGMLHEAETTLAAYEDDDVSAHTRAKSLLSLGRPAEAAALFRRLVDKYPDEPRPRAGLLEAELEAALAAGEEEAAVDGLEKGIAEAPSTFGESSDGAYIQGRACELRHEWDEALAAFLAARDRDPTFRTATFRAAYVAERGGLDELALELYEGLVDMPPVDKSVLLNLGMLYEDFGRDQDAAACYETVVRTHPADKRARLYLEDARQAIDMFYDEDQERKEDRLNQILRIPITDFELSVRARNCLNKMNITTLGDLVCRTEQELLSYKNFGETSLNEIKEILHSKGLRLGMPREEAVASVESAARRSQTADPGDLLNKPITELQLSIRARRTVESLGCLTVGDIIKHSNDELLGMPNFGVTSLQELKNKLAELGLKLRGEA